MTKQDFIKKWIGWVSYTNREKLTNEMEVDLELVSQALRIHDVVGQKHKLKIYKNMSYKEKISNIDKVLSELKTLKSEYQKAEKLSEKSLNMDFKNNTPKQIQKASVDLNWQCMHIDKVKKRVWKSILESELEVDISETDYYPSGFHHYKN